MPSLQAVPFAFAGFEHTPVEVLQVPSVWHWSDAVQTTGFEPVQVPDWHVSVCVQALPSLHVVPFAFAGFEHTPVEVLQIPSVWHWSDAVQTTGFEPVQVPDWQVSVWVQALPSLQVAPFAFAGSEHTPVEVLQVPSVWHWSEAGHVTGFDPTQAPAWQVSVWVHAFPSLHVVPFAFGATVQVEVPLQARVLHWSLAHVIAVPEHVPAPSHRSL